MKTITRSLLALSLIGLGLVVGAQLTPGQTSSTSRPQGATQPDVYFLIPATASISISTLNGTASLIVSHIEGNLSYAPPIVNVSVVEKDIVTFRVPARGYYAVQFLENSGAAIAIAYTLTIGGQPYDATLAGAIVFAVGLMGTALVVVAGRRRKVAPE